mgnify:CR=1 FL=1
MSSLVCGLDVHKDSVYATVMNYDGEIVDKRKLTNDEVANFLSRYPIDEIAIESPTSCVHFSASNPRGDRAGCASQG